MAPETALSVEFWPIEDLVPNPRNARLHDEEQIAQIRRSIEEFGFTNPILLGDVDGEIVAGHGRRRPQGGAPGRD
ncbi:ParB N-terminal domain-containing protein [Bosea vestrisii]|uniref:ParB N-terminal domain-containing protein n=1 Tax=Bosea vestrisii TaxID=151416 RepID=A0ABW0H3J7_9HYPH